MRINRVIQTGVVLIASAHMASAGWNSGALGELARNVHSQKTTGFLVIQDGKINGSTYALQAPDRDFDQQVWLRLMKAISR